MFKRPFLYAKMRIMDYFITLFGNAILSIRMHMSWGAAYMRYLHVKVFVLATAALLLAGCSDPNPLLGKWALQKTSGIKAYDFKMAQVTGNGQITFKEDRVISGKKALEVSYSVSGAEVTVKYAHNGNANTYAIIDDNYFMFDIPEVGTFKYVRVH